MAAVHPDGLRPSWVEVDLGALRHNLTLLRGRAPAAKLLAVVKADAYGHGAAEVSRALAAAGADWLGVAMVEEGVALRVAGLEPPILVLGLLGAGQVEAARGHRLTPAVGSLEQLRLWEESRLDGPPQPLHLKVDTGMGRLGIPGDALGEALERVRRAPHLELAGVMSHLAAADEVEHPANREQRERFAAALDLLLPAERASVVAHLANSAGALHHPAARHGMVRCGLALYGYDPAGRERDLRPVMAVRCRVSLLRQVAAGSGVGYNFRWRAARPSRIGVLPLGYADGYPWRLHGRGEALARGRRVALVGAVSMDAITVDLTDSEAGPGDELTLLGAQGEEAIAADELAAAAGTITYEILTGFGLRLPRFYQQGGETVAVASHHPAA
ncbi:MAG TPA: alanine racemase [Thermoanaerobaculia bacterium]|nr:alanine racemase [Thermoanaerobaculia bacterium]